MLQLSTEGSCRPSPVQFGLGASEQHVQSSFNEDPVQESGRAAKAHLKSLWHF